MASCATTGCDDAACRLCTVVARLPEPGALLEADYARLRELNRRMHPRWISSQEAKDTKTPTRRRKAAA